MALDSYANLKLSVQDWLGDRTDLEPKVDDFLDMAEADFNRVLRTREMEETATLTLDANGEASLPADYLEWRTVTALTSPRRLLEYMTPDYMEETFPTRYSGLPSFFTVREGTITVQPLTSDSVRLDYYETIPALSDSTTSNWLLVRYPNLYLYNVLKHASVYMREPAAAQEYAQLVTASLAALVDEDRRAKYARGAMRVSGPTP